MSTLGNEPSILICTFSKKFNKNIKFWLFFIISSSKRENILNSLKILIEEERGGNPLRYYVIIKSGNIQKYCCEKYGLYHASVTYVTSHQIKCSHEFTASAKNLSQLFEKFLPLSHQLNTVSEKFLTFYIFIQSSIIPSLLYTFFQQWIFQWTREK